MDDSLNTLENVVHLSLSTNSIDRMIALPKLSKSSEAHPSHPYLGLRGKLENLEILSLGRNQIKRIMGLEEIG